jgi:hypothetical protein
MIVAVGVTTMARPKIYRDAAMRQRAYRSRLKERTNEAEIAYMWRLEKLHQIVRAGAKDGNELAKILLGRNKYDTALRVVFYSQPSSDEDEDQFTDWCFEGFDALYYAYEEAMSDLLLKKSGEKVGVFKVG